jgi:hypothetical protein
MDKLFSLAGTSTREGINTFRFANGKLNLRRNALKHYGHAAIELRELPRPMTKVQAMAWLVTQGIDTAVLPTRAADKTRKPALQLEAEKLATKRMRDAARKREKRAAAHAE